jgi:transposase
MNKSQAGQNWYVGIDVSARELVVAMGNQGGSAVLERYDNTAAGQQQLVKRLRSLRAAGVTVCLEASGNYSLDVALGLARMGGAVKLQVANPRRVRRFAESLGQRSKTDPVDARVLSQYAERMPLVEWQPPSAAALQLRAMSRTIAALVVSAKLKRERFSATSPEREKS